MSTATYRGRAWRAPTFVKPMSSMEFAFAFDRANDLIQPLWSPASHRNLSQSMIEDFKVWVQGTKLWTNFFYKGKFLTKKRKPSTEVQLFGHYKVKPVEGWWKRGY